MSAGAREELRVSGGVRIERAESGTSALGARSVPAATALERTKAGSGRAAPCRAAGTDAAARGRASKFRFAFTPDTTAPLGPSAHWQAKHERLALMTCLWELATTKTYSDF